jgi:hypothetical protein
MVEYLLDERRTVETWMKHKWPTPAAIFIQRRCHPTPDLPNERTNDRSIDREGLNDDLAIRNVYEMLVARDGNSWLSLRIGLSESESESESENENENESLEASSIGGIFVPRTKAVNQGIVYGMKFPPTREITES